MGSNLDVQGIVTGKFKLLQPYDRIVVSHKKYEKCMKFSHGKNVYDMKREQDMRL